MVFLKRGGLKQNEKWTYNGIDIEVVDKYGVLLSQMILNAYI